MAVADKRHPLGTGVSWQIHATDLECLLPQHSERQFALGVIVSSRKSQYGADMNAAQQQAIVDFAMPDLKREESWRLTAYPDPLSGGEPWTIGYGSTGNGIGPGTVWTQAQADAALEGRCTHLVGHLDSALPWYGTAINTARQAVLLDMAYNLGFGGLLSFHNTLTFIQQGAYDAAANSMRASRWAKQLPSRSARLAQQMKTGTHA